jgi:hypothetical protein
VNTDDFYGLLRSGTPEERQSFFRTLRPRTAASQFAALKSMDPDAFIATLIPAIATYYAKAPDDFGTALPEAVHRYAIEVYQGPVRRKLSPAKLGSIAKVYVAALARKGLWQEIVEFGDRWIPFYQQLGKRIDIDWLQQSRNEALSMIGADIEVAEQGASDFLGVDDSFQFGAPSEAAKAAEPEPQAASPPSSAERKSSPPVSTGFADIASPGAWLQANQPIVPGKRYYFWLEVADVKGSIEEKPTPLPVEMLPARAAIVVVLFAPDSGLRVDPDSDLGELQLQSDGTATVLKQPIATGLDAPKELLARRLLFPVHAQASPGNYRLRCSMYCHGVLIQSRMIQVTVGGTERVSRVDYTLATRLKPEQLAALAEHRFSMHLNQGPGSNHDFYFHGAPGGKPFSKSLSVNADILDGLLQTARAALRRASWGDEETWKPDKRYRYDGKPSIDTLRQDLAVLAIAGYRIFDELANKLAGGKENVARLKELVAVPGLVQISAEADLGMVLPAALIYDYKTSLRTPSANFKLCPEFERAYRNKTPLVETACFQGHCPSKLEESTVCPSGFWGFRHALGLPFSNSKDGDETKDATFETRIEYSDVPVLIVGVSKAPDLPLTAAHTKELLALRPEWSKRAWLVRDSLDPLLYAMRSSQPHLVYMYCHSSGRPVGSAEIPMLYLGANPQAPQPGEWLEKATLRDEIEWSQPRPLVFLNGCQTTKLDAGTILNFVTGFVENANACGVIGTEITVFEKLAGAFAARFIDRFLGGAMVGQAIRDARLDLLQEGNPLGLVYTPFVLSGTQLVKV